MRVAVRRLSRSRFFNVFEQLSGVRVILTTEYASRHFVRYFATTIGFRWLWLSVSQVTEKTIFNGAKFRRYEASACVSVRGVCTTRGERVGMSRWGS
jgi:hypothetical protein